MARSFNGRGSEGLYNSELYNLYEIMEHINATPDDVDAGPITSKEGALWLDRLSSGDLKYRMNGEWKTIYNDRFRMICEILSADEPENPVSGQLWLKDGILMYYTGAEWLPVKSVNVSADFNLSSFEQFLIITPMKSAGNLVVDNDGSYYPEIKALFKEEEFDIVDAKQTIFELKNGSYSVGRNTLNVYVNGRKIPKSGYVERSSTSFELLDYVQAGSTVLAEYTNMVQVEQAIADNINDVGISDLIVDKYKTQFLLPNVNLDKVFVNGMYDDSYEQVTNIAIQYPSQGLQGKVTTGVHVNPSKLIDITKKVYKVDKNNPIIPTSERYTEFYGITDGIGKLLVKSDDSSTDYRTVTQGICLSSEAAALFDYVYAITYVFKNVKHDGELIRKKIMLSEDASVHVGDIDDPLCVFTQGLYLSEEAANYTYDKSTGYVSIRLEAKMDIGVIAFPKKENGVITQIDGSGNGVIHMNKTYNDFLLFVYGESMNSAIADYTVDKSDKSVLYVKNAKRDMRYAIVEVMGEREEDQLSYSKGTTLKDPITGNGYIPMLPDNELTETDGVIVFVNGLLIMRNDVVINSAESRIEIDGLKPGMDYIVLKDTGGRFVFSDYVSFSTIPLGHKSDTAIAYVENNFICDAKAVYTTFLPIKANEGEIKCLTTSYEEEWYIRQNRQWVKLDRLDPEVQKLKNCLLHYSSDDYVINILKRFGRKECTIFSYQYANAVEYPLLRGNIMSYESKDLYKVAFNHKYPAGKNSLSIWQNGLRQYPDTSGNHESPNGYFELGNGEFLMPEPIDGNIFYVVEKPEGNEIKACERQILTSADRIPGSHNTYQTDISLNPGNVRVFISGLRQPETTYKIIDSHTIMLYNEIIGSASNFPTETIINEDGEIIELTRDKEDSILIEVREDYKLKEITIPVRYAGQNEFNLETYNSDKPSEGGDELPESLIYSSDFIMIYVNGLAYGKDYKIDKDRETIILTNDTITSALGVDPVEQYFKNNPTAYQKWKAANGGKEYVARPIMDKITFEWR